MTTESANINGNMSILAGGRLQGWVIGASRDKPAHVQVYVNNERTVTLNAEIYRPDLIKHGLSEHGYCGFQLELSELGQLSQGTKIHAIIEETGNELKNSPIITTGHESDVFIFVHIPKTAGTSFRTGLEEVFGENRCMFDYDRSAQKTSKEVLETVYSEGGKMALYDILMGKGYRVLSGHFPKAKYSPRPNPHCRYVTFVREPVRRVISAFLHFKRHHGYEKSITEFVESKQSINKQAYCFGDSLSGYDFVGISEYYSQSVDLFEIIFGIKVPKMSVNLAPPEEVQELLDDAELCERIESLNQADVTIYNHCKSRFIEDLNKYGIDFVP